MHVIFNIKYMANDYVHQCFKLSPNQSELCDISTTIEDMDTSGLSWLLHSSTLSWIIFATGASI